MVEQAVQPVFRLPESPNPKPVEGSPCEKDEPRIGVHSAATRLLASPLFPRSYLFRHHPPRISAISLSIDLPIAPLSPCRPIILLQFEHADARLLANATAAGGTHDPAVTRPCHAPPKQ